MYYKKRKMAFDVISFGGSVVDVFIRTDMPEKNNFISYPVGTKILIKDLKFDIGGGAINTASVFSRLGLKTGCITKVGDDINGRKILSVLNKEGITFLGTVDKEGISGYSVILDSQNNDRTILTYKGLNDKITFEEINLRKIDTKWIYFSSLFGKSLDTQKKLARVLYDKGVKIGFNPNPTLIRTKDLDILLELSYVLIINEEEAEILAKKKRLKGKDLLKGIHGLGPKIVVITNKNKPIVCYDGVKKYSITPHKIKVIERTGGGDAFAAGFISGLIAGKSINDSLKLGLKESEDVIRQVCGRKKSTKTKLKKSSFFSSLK